MLSIVIPAYKELYLDKTVESISGNATGKIEIIVVHDDGKGMRSCINEGISQAKGDYIMKSDAHCLYAKGFDEALTKDCRDNWLVVPPLYTLDETNWRVKSHTGVSYYYYAYPYEREKWGSTLIAMPMGKDSDLMIDDLMAFPGSCWMVNRQYFIKTIGKLDDQTYAGFGGEQIEIGLKYWLGGGEVKVNKNTWYAHLGKRRKFHLKTNKSNYNLKRSFEVMHTRELITKQFVNNEIPNMVHPFSWLIEKFWPVPDWPENWKELLPKIKYKYL